MRWFERLFLFAAALLVARGLLHGARDLSNTESYASRRNAGGFLGMDMDAVPRVIDRHLSAQTPVALGESFYEDREFAADFWFRATSVLYPRRLVASASHQLEIAPPSAKKGVTLGTLPDGRAMVLTGPEDPSPGPAGATTTFFFDPVSLLEACVSLLGLGALFIRACRLGPVTVSGAALAGGLALTIAAHVATWVQRPLPWTILIAAGLASALVESGRLALRSPGRGTLGRGWSPWTIVPIAIVILAALRSLLVPVTEWDGRFVWLVHGKQLFFHGFLDASESATLAPLQPTYPLLTPALYSFGSSLKEAFNEKTAVFLGVVFHAAVIGALTRIAILVMGPLRGALFTSLVASASFSWLTEAYADGLLSSLLILQFLALQRNEKLGWLAMACAALTKREGLILALVVAVMSKGLRHFRPIAACLLPAGLHVLWCRFVGLSHDLDVPRIPIDFIDLLDRSLLIVRKSLGVVARYPHYALAGTALLSLVALRPGRSGSMSRGALPVALCCALFIFVTFLVTPQPLRWHLDTALPRLMLHPVLFTLLGLFLVLEARSEPI